MDLQTAQSFNFRNVCSKTTTYTALYSDEWIKMTGTYTITLPVISTLPGYLLGQKSFKIENVSGVVTISPGTGNTINGTTSYVLYEAGDYCIISIASNRTDWKVDYPSPNVKSISIPFEQILRSILSWLNLLVPLLQVQHQESERLIRMRLEARSLGIIQPVMQDQAPPPRPLRALRFRQRPDLQK